MTADREQPDEHREKLSCSFCNKTEDDVGTLFAGEASNICDECVETLAEILADARTRETAAPEAAGASTPVSRMWIVECSLCRIPVEAEDLVAVVGRGRVCSPCIAAVQAVNVPRKDPGGSGE